jgi:hypothetical protein
MGLPVISNNGEDSEERIEEIVEMEGGGLAMHEVDLVM